MFLTSEQKSIIEEIERNYSKLRWTTVINMPGNGKNSLIQGLVGKLNPKRNIELQICSAVTREDLKIFVENLTFKEDKFNFIIILINETFEDQSWIIPELYKLILSYMENLFILIAAPIGNLLSSLKENQKVIVKNRFIIPCANKFDAFELMKLFTTEIDFKKEINYEEIFELTNGHFGLMKYIIEIISKEREINLDIQYLLKQPGVIMWLEKIVNDLPEEQWKKLISGELDIYEKEVFKELGYIDDSNIKIPLLKTYLTTKFTDKIPGKGQSINAPSLAAELPYREMMLLNKLTGNLNNIVTRDETCEVLWGENWVDKYSDWALSQVILDIRKEIEARQLPYVLKTVKGQGFVLLSN